MMEATWSAKIKGVEQLPPEMGGALAEGITAGLETIGVKGAQIVQDYIRTPFGDLPPAVAFGNLVAAVAPRFVVGPQSGYGKLPGTSSVIIGVSPQLAASAYAAPVETGARAHMPPTSALVMWVQKKFNISDEKQALHVAFAVAKKMSKKGTRGHQMFSRALADLQEISAPILEKSIAQSFYRNGFVPIEGLA